MNRIIDQLNIPVQCKKYGLGLWECPQFLFLILGLIVIITTVLSYLIGAVYINSPELLALIVLAITAFLLVISFVITQSFQRLAEASRMKSEFINIVSHQLRSPLTNIKWTFEVLTSEDFKVPEEKQEEYFINVKENIARMIELVDDLLVVSKIEEGIFAVVKKEVSLDDLIRSLISRYKVFAESSHINLIFQSGKDVPNIFADSSMLKLVIENLIDNAIRYTRGGGKVEIKTEKQDKKVVVSVSDSGVGIPGEEQKYIFQKFFRAENVLKQRTKGSGLGLYVCKTIILKSGGKIWFESKEGRGTTFYFSLQI
ncbi:MAG: HAMP domain-containing sensor histidine kinase [bacterium]|nr:HAMP domain-containing sensor histidine kinase [bacterium]